MPIKERQIVLHLYFKDELSDNYIKNEFDREVKRIKDHLLSNTNIAFIDINGRSFHAILSGEK